MTAARTRDEHGPKFVECECCFRCFAPEDSEDGICLGCHVVRCSASYCAMTGKQRSA